MGIKIPLALTTDQSLMNMLMLTMLALHGGDHFSEPALFNVPLSAEPFTTPGGTGATGPSARADTPTHARARARATPRGSLAGLAVPMVWCG